MLKSSDVVSLTSELVEVPQKVHSINGRHVLMACDFDEPLEILVEDDCGSELKIRVRRRTL